MAYWATRDVYQDSLYVIYPAMAPDTIDQLSKFALAHGVKPGHGWTRSFQACHAGRHRWNHLHVFYPTR